MEERTFLVTFQASAFDRETLETEVIRQHLRNSCNTGALYFKDVQRYILGNEDSLVMRQAVQKIRKLTDLSLPEAKNLIDLAQLRVSNPTVEYKAITIKYNADNLERPYQVMETDRPKETKAVYDNYPEPPF